MAEAIPILEIGVILLGAALVGFLARRAGLPAVVGYLVVGLLVGPFTPGYVADRHQIQVLADVGVVLLLFEVGIELDLNALRREPLGILVAVPAQVLLGTVIGAAAFVALAATVQDWVVPRLLRTVREEPDTFLIVAVSAALVTAGVGATLFGVPLALAAFISGLFLSVRVEAQEARREVLPFRDLFAVMFFVAIGTLVDPSAILREPGWLALVLVLVVTKSLLVWLLAALFRVPARRPQLGVGLGQIGEFSFVVLGLGTAASVVTAGQFSAALGAAAITIAVSAIGVRLFPRGAP